MPIDLTQFATDFAGIIADLPQTFTFNGISFTGAFMNLDTTDALREGGILDDFDASLHARYDLFSTIPEVGMTIGIGAKAYRIIRTSRSPDDLELRIDIATKEK